MATPAGNRQAPDAAWWPPKWKDRSGIKAAPAHAILVPRNYVIQDYGEAPNSPTGKRYCVCLEEDWSRDSPSDIWCDTLLEVRAALLHIAFPEGTP